MNWYLEVLKKYAVFGGRARRSEYWYFALFSIIASVVLSIVDGVLGTYNATTGMGAFSTVYGLGVLIPSIAVSIRRLHDTDRSGWWLLIALIPILGLIALLIFATQDSKPGTNQYGPNPKEGTPQ